MTGRGNPGHVQADPQRIAIANELFSKHPDYGLVKFHTHSIGTIKVFGEYYATNFSQEDINIYEEQIKHDSRFIGLVITPQTKLLYGRNNPILKIIDQPIPKISYQINNEIRKIASQRGYELKNFISKKTYQSPIIL